MVFRLTFAYGRIIISIEQSFNCLQKEVTDLRNINGSEPLPSCETTHVHGELIKRVCEMMPDTDSLYDLAELFKIFGDSTRVRILFVLLESEMCVCDLAETLGMTASAISHQLRVLKAADLVRYRRDGKTVFYSLADDHVRSILSQGLDHINE